MLAKFRHHYPQGSLLGELVKIDRGLFIVRVSIQMQDKILATALAGADSVEAAEDKARHRAIATLIFDNEQSISSQPVTSTSASNVKFGTTSMASVSTLKSSQSAFTSEPTVESISNNNVSDNLVNHNNVVDLAEHQTEPPNQNRIAEKTNSSPPPKMESPTPQKNMESPVKDAIQPTTETGNLFGEVLVAETSNTEALNDFQNNIVEIPPPRN